MLHLHSENIIHRDLAVRNILLTEFLVLSHHIIINHTHHYMYRHPRSQTLDYQER